MNILLLVFWSVGPANCRWHRDSDSVVVIPSERRVRYAKAMYTHVSALVAGKDSK